MTRQPGRRGPARRADVSELSADRRRHLERGWYFFEGFGSIHDYELAWKTHREELLAEWIRERPGTRPFAMWLCELIPKYGEREVTEHWNRECELNRREWERMGILHLSTTPELQESEEEFLRRNGLLTEKERTTLCHE